MFQNNAMSKAEFGKYMTDNLKRMKVSTADACREFKVSRATLERWKAGESMPHFMGMFSIYSIMKNLDREHNAKV